MGYELVCTRGPMKGRRWNLTPDGLKIGRAESCEIRTSDASVELYYCIVKLVDDKPFVQNLASDKGVNVNGLYVPELQLKAADTIVIGGDWLTIEEIAEDGGAGLHMAAPAIILALVVAVASFALWRKSQGPSPVVPCETVRPMSVDVMSTNYVVSIITEEVVITNRTVQTVDDVLVTNYVVCVVTNEVVMTNLMVQIADGVMVTNCFAEVGRIDGKMDEVIDGRGNEYVSPPPSDGLVLSEDGKTLLSVTNELKHVTIPDGVIAIGERAFAGLSALKSVSIPPSLAKIDRNAFRGCDGLEGVYITDLAAWCRISFESADPRSRGDNPLTLAHNLYLDGILVRDLEIPREAVSIGKCVFRGCSSLKSVKIHKGVIEIGPGAFADCDNLVEIEVEGGNRRYKSLDGLLLTRDGRGLFAVPGGRESVKIPDGVTIIGPMSFRGCGKLSNLTIPNGVTDIVGFALANCRRLARLEIPPSVDRIDYNVFLGCDNLTDIYISDLAAWCRMSVRDNGAPPDFTYNLYLNGVPVKDMKIPIGVRSIGSHVFRGCSSLTCVTIPQGVDKIGFGAFYNCKNLAEFRVAGGNYWYKDDAGFLMTRDGKTLIAAPAGIVDAKIPGGTEVIADYAFSSCDRLSSVEMPRGITSIGNRAFAFCKELISVELPDGAKSLGRNVFQACTKLGNITIPGSVENIEYGDFWGSGLTNVVIQPGARNIGPKAFENTRITNIVIPDSVTNIDWSAFAHCLQLESVTIPEGLTNIHERAFSGCKRLLDDNGRPRLTRVPSAPGKAVLGRPAK